MYHKDIVFTHALFVFSNEHFSRYAVLQSGIHEMWARKYSSKLKTDLRYAPTDCFETFPFPIEWDDEKEQELEQIGEEHHEFRRQLMLELQLGLTKTYNLFHTRDLTPAIVQAACANSTGNDSATLSQSHYEKILHLRLLHRKLDETVQRAYGWEDIALAHDFYEIETLPENDRVRYTIAPAAREVILQRLLALNHELGRRE